ncbi:hypothetical protein ACFWWT_29830 [Streptomyces sp. NPDC058676]|uniref:hypothetical protein n=1 Tax=unclassified Streptomyces TaxID=2593676 RepID=UPI00366A4413
MKPSNTADPTTPPAPPAPGPAPGAGPGPGRLLVGSIRAAASLALFCSLLQAALAGLFVTGDVGMLDLHGMNAGLVHLFTLTQVVLSIVLWRKGRAPKWPMAATTAALLMGATQQVLGDERVIAWHILLGTAIVAAHTALTIWAFSLRTTARAAGGQR